MRNQLSLILAVFLIIGTVAHAQTSVTGIVHTKIVPKTKTIFYRIGETQFPIRIMQYGDVKDIVYINLHADEITALNAAKLILEKEGGTLIVLDNERKRNIRFKLKGRYYLFDPNRMFSREGAKQTLSILGRTSPDAITEVELFGKRVLELLPANLSMLVALHNNTDGKFGINSYLPGAERENDAKEVYAEPTQDPDDIFLTTDSLLYRHLAAEKYNSILQHNENAKKDGSLSIYCGEKNITYLNCETQHGRYQQYVEMLAYALTHFEKDNAAMISYTFTIDLSGGEDFVTPNTIYYGEEVIGQAITLENTATPGLMKGSLQIKNDFRLMSNMDLFMFTSATASPRIELRMDPTREGIPVDPKKSSLSISIRK